MLALGVLLPHDKHDPACWHEAEGHDREDDDEKRLDEIEEFLNVRRLYIPEVRTQRVPATSQDTCELNCNHRVWFAIPRRDAPETIVEPAPSDFYLYDEFQNILVL